jgi:hypothetical protein
MMVAVFAGAFPRQRRIQRLLDACNNHTDDGYKKGIERAAGYLLVELAGAPG